MSKCYTCSKSLTGSWNMTQCNGYEMTGRYIGIQDGYFLYGESPNWVYCYCKNCWMEAILKLPFVQQRISQTSSVIIQPTQDRAKLDFEQFQGPPHEILQNQLKLAQIQIGELQKKVQEQNQIIEQLVIFDEMRVNSSSIVKLRQICEEVQVDSALQIKQKNLSLIGNEFNKLYLQQIPIFKEELSNLLNELIEGGSAQLGELLILENNIVTQFKKSKFQFGQEEINESVRNVLKKKQFVEDSINKWTEQMGKLMVIK